MKKRTKILELDQHTATGNVENFSIKDFEKKSADIRGGDAETAQRIASYYYIRMVSEEDYPPLGYVWFKVCRGGKLKRWKANYDTSD